MVVDDRVLIESGHKVDAATSSLRPPNVANEPRGHASAPLACYAASRCLATQDLDRDDPRLQ